jgi:molybdenum cofactor cytidylyltransferase
MDLCDALAVRPGDVVALVGGGGKTSALYRLGQELGARGWPVVLGGTTRFTPPESGAAPNLRLLAERGPAWLSGQGAWPLTVATGWGNNGRLLPVSMTWVDELHAAHPDWTVVLEADGSAMRPFKAPAAHEPAIPAAATLVVAVAGIDAAGRALDETHVHRPEQVRAISGAAPGSLVDERLMAAVLAHPEGGRKSVPVGARWVPLINKADTEPRLARALVLAHLLRGDAERVVVAQLRHDPPVVCVV